MHHTRGTTSPSSMHNSVLGCINPETHKRDPLSPYSNHQMTLSNNKFLKRFVNLDEKKSGSAAMGILVGAFAAFAGVLFGYDTGTISGVLAMDYVLERFPENTPGAFSSSEHSLIVSILSVGTFFGALLAPLLSETLGRRWTILIGTLVVFNVGVILQVASHNIELLCAGRAIGGFGVGMISAVVPLYQSETTPKWIRGAVVSCYQWAITIGLLLAAIVNQATMNRNDSGSYRIPFAIQFLWAMILGGGMLYFPESPRFWVSKGAEEKAFKSLAFLRKLPEDHPEIVEEYEEIRASYEYELSQGKSGWIDVFSPKGKQLKKLITGVGLQAFQQLTGINFIFYYGTTFFKSSGIQNSFLIQMATNIVNVGMTIPGILLVEVLGRRSLLLIGAAGMCVSDFIIAIVGVSTDSAEANKVLVAFACIFIAFFAATWGPICWVIVGEIFPLRTRAKSVALSAASNWLWNWGIAYATPYMVDSGPGNANMGSNVFFVWGGFNLLALVFTFWFVYETKGYTLEQIDELYEQIPFAWKSKTFVPTTRNNEIAELDFAKGSAVHVERSTSEESV